MTDDLGPERTRRRTSLSDKQMAILEMIQRSVSSRGYPPSMREIGEAVGLTSSSSVAHQLKVLEEKGFLKRDPNRPRALEVFLPEVMAASDAIANKVDRACVDAAEVAVLAGRVGERFDALVLRAPDGDDEKEAGEVYVLDPPVLARCTGKLTAGARAGVRLTEADPVARRVSFHAD